ncbi:YhcN/YlaJ family sporulation lipoprotein [Bacillus manliponensis]|uniref:YhcN/YlaJ family sporulation lipoprotein n=1 Tax=Bacillus manliponensis TaxID=574376 RepID=UPI00351435ED
MNKKVKIIAASLLVTSALAACNPGPDDQAIDRNNAYNYERTSNYNGKDYVTRNGRYMDYVSYKDGAGYNYYGDRNYHGQVGNPYPTRNITMNNGYVNRDGKTAEEITNRVERMNNVERVSTVVYGDEVVIAVKTNKHTNEKALAEEVRKAAAPYAKNRSIYVTVKDDMFERVDEVNNQLRTGTVTNDFNDDITDMFRNIRDDFNDMFR